MGVKPKVNIQNYATSDYLSWYSLLLQLDFKAAEVLLLYININNCRRKDIHIGTLHQGISLNDK